MTPDDDASKGVVKVSQAHMTNAHKCRQILYSMSERKSYVEEHSAKDKLDTEKHLTMLMLLGN